MSSNIIKEKETEKVNLFMKNVEWDKMGSMYVGDSVNSQGIASMTEEMLYGGNFEFITDSSEIWEVEEYTIYVCSQCGIEAMYDTKQNTFYCPRCES